MLIVVIKHLNPVFCLEKNNFFYDGFYGSILFLHRILVRIQDITHIFYSLKHLFR